MKRIFCLCLLFLNAYLGAIEPQIVLVFGITGDLANKKLIPALNKLSEQQALPAQFAFVGLGRQEKTDDDFRNQLGKDLKEHSYYVKINFDDFDDYLHLKDRLDLLNKTHGAQGNFLYYLATPPSYFPTIIENLKKSGLLQPNHLLVIEKPFGRDLTTAIELQNIIQQHLNPDQIYLIDHYLAKEVVQNLLTIRFSNPLFQSIWNKDHIERIDITLSEDIGVGMRGQFWEETGLLRDLIQNHALQLLSLIAMEQPDQLEAAAIRAEKIKLVKAIRPFSLGNLDNRIVRGQYASGMVNGTQEKGYRQEDGVAPDSSVETFVATQLFIDNERWLGVPFYIKGGKRLDKRLTEIVVHFKGSSNKLIFRIQPDEEIYLVMNSKKPGLGSEIQQVKMQFNYRQNHDERLPDAYETLLNEAMNKRQDLFVDVEEILESWRLFTPVLTHWEQNPPANFPNYQAGTWGPLKGLWLWEDN